jgi:nicotinamidase-related amidase
MEAYMTDNIFTVQAQTFVNYLIDWQSRLPSLAFHQAITEPQHTAILSIDVTNGFCYEGPLASPRVQLIVSPIVALFKKAWDIGLRSILLLQDTHDPQAVEFSQWPPHCVAGTTEAEPVPEIKALPFYDQINIFPKNSINPALNTELPEWIMNHPEIKTYITVGDCTDLCTYQLAMYLRTDANARQIERRIILPENCVNTYDIPVETARKSDIMPHPGDFIHTFFLYHMALNGIEVVRNIS